MKKYTLRLKDIENIGRKKPDYAIIMKEVLGFNNFFIGRKYVFTKKFKQAHFLISEARQVDPKTIVEFEDCEINIPNSIDNISFRAMMEIRSVMSNYDGTSDFGIFVSKVIATVCYQENVEGKFDSNCLEFKEFQDKILGSPIWKMIGLYNWIDKALGESNKEWSKRFFSVEVSDPDYDLANGQRMDQFNVINTIKNICSDFNCSYDEAWQMSYALTQTNSYSKATQNRIQDDMRQIKEAKMIAQRATNVK